MNNRTRNPELKRSLDALDSKFAEFSFLAMRLPELSEKKNAEWRSRALQMVNTVQGVKEDRHQDGAIPKIDRTTEILEKLVADLDADLRK